MAGFFTKTVTTTAKEIARKNPSLATFFQSAGGLGAGAIMAVTTDYIFNGSNPPAQLPSPTTTNTPGSQQGP